MSDTPKDILPISGYNFTLAMNEIFGDKMNDRQLNDDL